MVNVSRARRGAGGAQRVPAPAAAPLIICFGNPLHGDDAVGWRVAERLPAAQIGARVVACHALAVELAPAMAAAELVIFVGRSDVGTAGEIRCTPIEPRPDPVPPHGDETPASLVARAKARGGPLTAAYAITIAVGQVEIGAPLSAAVAAAVPHAVALISAFVARVAAAR